MSYQEKRKKNSASVLFQSQKILEKAGYYNIQNYELPIRFLYPCSTLTINDDRSVMPDLIDDGDIDEDDNSLTRVLSVGNCKRWFKLLDKPKIFLTLDSEWAEIMDTLKFKSSSKLVNRRFHTYYTVFTNNFNVIADKVSNTSSVPDLLLILETIVMKKMHKVRN